MIWLAQAEIADSLTKYGILGILGLVIAVGAKLVYDLVQKQNAANEVQAKNFEAQTARFMEFVDTHRGETAEALAGMGTAVATSSEKMASTIASSHKDLSAVLSRQVRLFEQWMWAQDFWAGIKEAKDRGMVLTQEEVERIARAASERRRHVNGE